MSQIEEFLLIGRPVPYWLSTEMERWEWLLAICSPIPTQPSGSVPLNKGQEEMPWKQIQGYQEGIGPYGFPSCMSMHYPKYESLKWTPPIQ